MTGREMLLQDCLNEAILLEKRNIKLKRIITAETIVISALTALILYLLIV